MCESVSESVSVRGGMLSESGRTSVWFEFDPFQGVFSYTET